MIPCVGICERHSPTRLDAPVPATEHSWKRAGERTTSTVGGGPGSVSVAAVPAAAAHADDTPGGLTGRSRSVGGSLVHCSTTRRSPQPPWRLQYS